MKVFGWIYIIFFCINAVLSLFNAISPGMTGIQIINGVTGVVIIILSIIVFILSCIGKLMPRKVFLLLPGYYFFTIVYGIIIGILLVMKVGAEKMMAGGATPELLSETFTWFTPVSWIMNITCLLLAIYGILIYLKSTGATEQPITID